MSQPRDHSVAHWLFLATLAGKGLLGIVQIAVAVSITLGMFNRLPAIVQSFVAKELAEDPSDFIAGYLLATANSLPVAHADFFAIYFGAHGLLHVIVVALLLFGRVWAYPFAILVLVAFIVYQWIEWMSVGGTMLLLLGVIDVFVIYLTVLEWRHRFPPPAKVDLGPQVRGKDAP